MLLNVKLQTLLDKETHARLFELAKKESAASGDRVSVGALVRRAIRAMLEKLETEG